MKKFILTGIPNSSGVYQFYDRSGELLYVGKAKNLKKRVASYFARTTTDRPWIEVMKTQIDKVEVIAVKNETDALMLEASLINQFKPRFNIQLTDDKSYPFIRLSVSDDYPSLQVIRQPKQDKARYFGPYLSAQAARATCSFLRRVYGVHISSKTISPTLKRPCFACQLEGNACVVAGEISQDQYRRKVNQAIKFLQGKNSALVQEIRKKMAESASSQQFELAAKWRDLLKYLKVSRDTPTVVGALNQSLNAVAVAKVNNIIIIALVCVREGRVVEVKYFEYKGHNFLRESEILEQFFITTYANTIDIVSKIVISHALDEAELVASYLSKKLGRKVIFIFNPRGKNRQFLELAQKNAQTKLEQTLIKKDATVTQLVSLKNWLKLTGLPNRIEAIDISNLGKSEAVGVSICFTRDNFDKNEFRRYKIKTVKGQNDFAMIGEIVKRRLSDFSRPAPDLLVIDGGKEQLAYAINMAKKFHKRPTIISLAKKPDRVFIENQKDPLPSKDHLDALRLLGKIRDEAHRFAVSFQRHRQRKKSLFLTS